MGNVYFVQCGDLVKIGYATDVAERLVQLQTGNPYGLALLTVIPDALPSLEKHLHRAFAAYRARGEWFQFTRAMDSFIAHIRAGARPKTPADIEFIKELRLARPTYVTQEEQVAEGKLHAEFRKRTKLEGYDVVKAEFLAKGGVHVSVVEAADRKLAKVKKSR